MKKKRIIWTLFPSFLALIVITLIAVEWHAYGIISNLYLNRTQSELRTGVVILAEQIKNLSETLAPEIIDPLSDRVGTAAGHRYTIVLPSGTVVGDSQEEPGQMDNHGSRPEIRQAFSGETGISKRYSNTLQKWMFYVAVPVEVEGKIIAAVRAAVPLADVRESMGRLHMRSLTAGLFIAVIAVLISIVLSRRISHPLRELRQGVETFGAGNLNKKLPSSNMLEIDILAETMNKMARQLNERIRLVTEQRDEQDSLLTCMIEGVIAIDLQKRIIKMNDSAKRLFSVNDAGFAGKSIEDVIRNLDLLEIIRKTTESSESIEGDVYIAGGERYLQAHGTQLHDDEGKKTGTLMVLNDITRLRMLETMRRDFVANVSHELKTPITSIKGFTETLLDGAAENKEDLHRFLQIINRQADRLQSIVEDLLVLSGIEHDAEKNEIELQPGRVDNIIDNAVQACRGKADEKEISIEVVKTAQSQSRINVQLLEQAVTNLIDNAIKYSETGTRIKVIGEDISEGIVIRVEDEGPGIAQTHQDRLFERFYRVDKSRSRNLGGTGLGLAIVKRIAIAHGGRVELDSQPGAGSAFSIILPKA